MVERAIKSMSIRTALGDDEMGLKFKFVGMFIFASLFCCSAFGSEINFSKEEFIGHLSKRAHYAKVIKLSDPILFDDFKAALKGRKFNSEQEIYSFWIEEIAPNNREVYVVLEKSSPSVSDVIFRNTPFGANLVSVGDEALIFFDLNGLGNVVTEGCDILSGEVRVSEKQFSKKDELIGWATNNLKSLCYTSGAAWKSN